MNLNFWLRRPHLVVARLRYWLWEWANPDKPWLTPGAVAFCARALDRSMHALEFGSGRSTAWFARHVGRLTSVEHAEAWYRKVREQLDRENPGQIDYRLVPLEHPEAEPEQEHYDPLPAYVGVLAGFPEESLDLVVIDGHYRTACLRACPPRLAPGGLLLVDDVHLWGGVARVPVPAGWPLVHRSGNGLKETCLWLKPARGDDRES